MIDQLIARIEAAAGISPDAARNALGSILEFLQKEAPELSKTLFSHFPGAQDLIAGANQMAGGGLSGLLGNFLGSIGGAGGDIMALGAKLLGQGLSMDQAKTVAGEVLDFARKEIGEEHVDALIQKIPGLSQIL